MKHITFDIIIPPTRHGETELRVMPSTNLCLIPGASLENPRTAYMEVDTSTIPEFIPMDMSIAFADPSPDIAVGLLFVESMRAELTKAMYQPDDRIEIAGFTVSPIGTDLLLQMSDYMEAVYLGQFEFGKEVRNTRPTCVHEYCTRATLHGSVWCDTHEYERFFPVMA